MEKHSVVDVHKTVDVALPDETRVQDAVHVTEEDALRSRHRLRSDVMRKHLDVGGRLRERSEVPALWKRIVVGGSQREEKVPKSVRRRPICRRIVGAMDASEHLRPRVRRRRNDEFVGVLADDVARAVHRSIETVVDVDDLAVVLEVERVVEMPRKQFDETVLRVARDAELEVVVDRFDVEDESPCAEHPVDFDELDELLRGDALAEQRRNADGEVDDGILVVVVAVVVFDCSDKMRLPG